MHDPPADGADPVLFAEALVGSCRCPGLNQSGVLSIGHFFTEAQKTDLSFP
jgi:hypothetical protein